MKLQSLGTDIGAAGAETGVLMNKMPFGEGAEAVVSFELEGFNGTAKLQSSDDDVTYADVVTVTEAVSSRTKQAQVTLKKYMRLNVTAWTAGDVTCNLLGSNP